MSDQAKIDFYIKTIKHRWNLKKKLSFIELGLLGAAVSFIFLKPEMLNLKSILYLLCTFGIAMFLKLRMLTCPECQKIVISFDPFKCKVCNLKLPLNLKTNKKIMILFVGLYLFVLIQLVLILKPLL
ncbi:MAG: hypothetical protein ACI9QD_000019 [Thermoproteota archaeon]|jgi:hypothetical protein